MPCQIGWEVNPAKQCQRKAQSCEFQPNRSSGAPASCAGDGPVNQCHAASGKGARSDHRGCDSHDNRQQANLIRICCDEATSKVCDQCAASSQQHQRKEIGEDIKVGPACC